LELPEHPFGFAEADKIGGGILRTRRNQSLERTRAFRPLAEIKLQAAKLQGSVASRSGRRGSSKQLFRLGIAAVVDIDPRAQGDRSRVVRVGEQAGDLFVLTEIERFAGGCEGIGRRWAGLRTQQRGDHEEQAASDDQLLHALR
jgi:hypothetical protein